MTRIGFADKAESIPEIRKIQELSNIHIEGMFTHFAKADETDLQPAIVQMKRFQNFARTLEKEGISIPLLHCSNSAGIMRLEEAQMDLVRAGITIYGLYPSNEVDRNLLKLRPAMELKSTVSYVKDVPAGVGISYGGTYVTDKPIRVATIPVGYADGYPRSLSNKGYVLIHGKRAPILGRICMDQFMVNVTGIQDVNAGDQVTLIGNDGDACILMEELGDLSGRFAYEFACGISARVPRVYLRGGEEYEP
jgi:alanine racemase